MVATLGLGQKMASRLNTLRYKASDLADGVAESKLLADADPLNAFIGYQQRVLQSCAEKTLFGLQLKFLELPAASCYRFNYLSKSIEVSYSDDMGKTWQQSGQVAWTFDTTLPRIFNTVYLPHEQKVFVEFPKDPTLPTYLSGSEVPVLLPIQPKFFGRSGAVKTMRLWIGGWNDIVAEGVEGDDIITVDLSQKTSSAPILNRVVNEPGETVLKEVQTRWNEVASSITIPGNPNLKFIWTDLNSFPHPTYRHGTNAAYLAFQEILVKFYEAGDNRAFLKRYDLFDYPFKMLGGTVRFRDFSR